MNFHTLCTVRSFLLVCRRPMHQNQLSNPTSLFPSKETPNQVLRKLQCSIDFYNLRTNQRLSRKQRDLSAPRGGECTNSTCSSQKPDYVRYDGTRERALNSNRKNEIESGKTRKSTRNEYGKIDRRVRYVVCIKCFWLGKNTACSRTK